MLTILEVSSDSLTINIEVANGHYEGSLDCRAYIDDEYIAVFKESHGDDYLDQSTFEFFL